MGRLIQLQGTPILPGEAAGIILAADTPLSFWGGFDPVTGKIIDQRHPLTGRIASGHILVIPSGRGSCSGSGVLLEAIRNGTAPAAIVTSRIDQIIALGAVLGDELYASHPVLIVVDDATRQVMRTGDWFSVAENGQFTVDQQPHGRP